MFGRATIRLGIGPHSSSVCVTLKILNTKISSHTSTQIIWVCIVLIFMTVVYYRQCSVFDCQNEPTVYEHRIQKRVLKQSTSKGRN